MTSVGSNPRASQCREDARQHATDHGQRDREEQDAPVEADVEIDDRRAAGEKRHQQIAPPRGDDQTERTADRRHDHRLDEQLPDDSPAAGAERGPNRHLARAGAGTGDEEARDVAAGDGQQHADHREQDQQPRRQVAAQERHAAAGARKSDHFTLEIGAAIGVRGTKPGGGIAAMERGQRRRDCVAARRVGNSREERQPLDARLRRPRPGVVRRFVGARVERVAEVGLHRERNPGVGIAEPDPRAEEHWRGNPDDRQAGAADDQLPPDDRRVPLESAPPVGIADDHHRALAGDGSVTRLDQPADLRALAEPFEETARDQLHAAPLGAIAAAREPDLHLRRRGRGKQLGTTLQLALRLLDERPRIAWADARGQPLFGGIQLLRIRHRQLAEHDGVEHGEDRGGSADAQRQRQDRDGGDQRGAAQDADRVAGVGQHASPRSSNCASGIMVDRVRPHHISRRPAREGGVAGRAPSDFENRRPAADWGLGR